MQAPIRKTVVMSIIVMLHAAVLTGFGHVKLKVRTDEAPAQPIAARLIFDSQDEPPREPSQPIHVDIALPKLAIRPPELPELRVWEDHAVEKSPRAITLPPPSSTVAGASTQSPRAHDRAPKLITTVEYVREPAPRYPPLSRKLREQGLVMLRVLIDEQGTACSIEIESSSGYARLDRAAREAVARAAFRPYIEDGEPRRAVVLIPIEFYLNPSAV